MKSLRRIVALARKEALHVARDPRSLYLALGMPVVLLVLFGFGVSFDMDHLPVAVIDEDRSRTSRALVERLFASSELELVSAGELRAEDAARLFERREAIGVLILPAGLEEDLNRGRSVSVQFLLDGVDPDRKAHV